jgi:PhoH-like ATPase
MVFRSIIEVENKTMGFLPGDVGEKFEPYIGPVLDCLELIFPSGDHDELVGHGKKDIGPNSAYEGLFAQKQLVTGPINFLRGRTLHQRFVITDEVQNITQLGVKTIGTRTGKQTKMVFLGDPTQIDVPFLSSVSCGLSHVVENLKEEETAANIRLIKNERDEVAAICARRL